MVGKYRMVLKFEICIPNKFGFYFLSLSPSYTCFTTMEVFVHMYKGDEGMGVKSVCTFNNILNHFRTLKKGRKYQ